MLRPEQTCEAEGWPRKKPGLGNVAKQVGFLKRLYVEGVEYLEDMGVYRNMSANREKGEPVSKNPSYQDDVTWRIFTATGGMTFFEFIWMLAFAPYSSAKDRPFYDMATREKTFKEEGLKYAAKRAVGW